MSVETPSRRADARRANVVEGVALSTSLLCLVHCLALPVLLLLLPGVIGLFARSEAFHYVALALVVPAALAAFRLGYRRHRARRPALLGLAGVACLVIALLPGTTEGSELWFTVAGSLLLVAGHTMNWRLRTHAA
ncbi:MAG: MerC mercury resistance protein [Alphaproteobacteria bacterium HGW-Alphaproteobacteria-13]|jgi:hypothetical protein|nr:MAG: MerC mercury resistance protein [Alphaproteobacteria bacterium HGW-Alphaproteobacteria-13]